MSVEIDEGVARRVLEIVDAGLVQGLGEPIPGKMGVVAAVCYALGLPHGAAPSCVARAVRRLTIRLNDSRWSSPRARASGMRRLAIAALGSAGVLDEGEFARRVVRLAIQMCVPTALRAAAQCCAGEQRARLLHVADLCAREPTRKNALEARAAIYAAAYADAAADAAYAATVADADATAAAYYAAATNAAFAADAAADAAAHAAAFAATADDAEAADEATEAADAAACAAADVAAADAAAAHAAADAAADAVADAHLSDFAEGVVQILRDMDAPGCAFLHLTEAA